MVFLGCLGSYQLICRCLKADVSHLLESLHDVVQYEHKYGVDKVSVESRCRLLENHNETTLKLEIEQLIDIVISPHTPKELKLFIVSELKKTGIILSESIDTLDYGILALAGAVNIYKEEIATTQKKVKKSDGMMGLSSILNEFDDDTKKIFEDFISPAFGDQTESKHMKNRDKQDLIDELNSYAI
eukprot:TRINITY_DN979_c0_g2_i2.p1 TRINITY_DN979_c0_g2~~TRINITY_DN979_c0_g2_i2.p1  ORF type:complete len:186 (-),score=35.95 TRINITY_DN979_c0_g2_i2:77-634(-)